MNLTPKEDKSKKFTLWIIEIAAACALLFLAIKNINVISSVLYSGAKILSPLLLGFIIALILNVPMKYFEERLWAKTENKFLKKIKKPIAFIISTIIILGILTSIFCLVIPELLNAAKVIFQEASNLIEKLKTAEDIEIAGFSIRKLLSDSEWNNMLTKGQQWLKENSTSIANSAITTAFSVIGGVINFFIALVFSIYILFSQEKLKSHLSRLIKAWLPQKLGKTIIHVSLVANSNFKNFISGQTLEAFILGILCTIGMLILKIPYAPMVGALVGITALVPIVGGFIGAGVGAFMILTVSPIKALVFVVFLVILQQLEGNIIYPKVMGSKVNLPAIWILAAVTIGGGIGGILGMFLSVPITATLYTLLKEATEKKELNLSVLEVEQTGTNNNPPSAPKTKNQASHRHFKGNQSKKNNSHKPNSNAKEKSTQKKN